MMKKISLLALFWAIFLLPNPAKTQFLHTKNQKILSPEGENFILRGMGLGGWMLQEPYMLQLSGATGPQHDIEAKIKQLIGKKNKEKFYAQWYDNHCTRTDIDSLAAWGFNHVRLPMHYRLFTLPIEKEPVKGKNTWKEKGFAMTDSLLKWCEANEMYLILDLHAAPGGQGKDSNISDYNPEKPSLWESPENKQKTIALWGKLAQRYANEKWIGGYDLINEPNWAFTKGSNPNGLDEKDNSAIWNLYKKITAQIRKFDKNHIIYIEGNGWATNFNGLPKLWDDQLVINFHGYWNETDASTIETYLKLREKHNAPLWMSESGENSNQWFKERIQMLEENNIGWAWWPMKKIGSVVGPLTVKPTENYKKIIRYWKNEAPRPDTAFATNALMKIAENLKIENCNFHPDVIDAMFRQRHEKTAIPYKKHAIPGKIAAVDYDMGSHQIAYHDKDYKSVTGLDSRIWNSGWTYRNDGVDIKKDPKNEVFYVTRTEKGEWLHFTAFVEKGKKYTLFFEIASLKPGEIQFELLNSEQIMAGSLVDFPPTGGKLKWKTIQGGDVLLPAGKIAFKIHINSDGFNLKNIELR